MGDPKAEPTEKHPTEPAPETDAERREIEGEEEAARLGDFA
jgi:hypothetical protein